MRLKPLVILFQLLVICRKKGFRDWSIAWRFTLIHLDEITRWDFCHKYSKCFIQLISSALALVNIMWEVLNCIEQLLQKELYYFSRFKIEYKYLPFFATGNLAPSWTGQLLASVLLYMHHFQLEYFNNATSKNWDH